MGQAENLDMRRPETGLGQTMNWQIPHRPPCYFLFPGKFGHLCPRRDYAGCWCADGHGRPGSSVAPKTAELLEMGRNHWSTERAESRVKGLPADALWGPSYPTQLPAPRSRRLISHLYFRVDQGRGCLWKQGGFFLTCPNRLGGSCCIAGRKANNKSPHTFCVCEVVKHTLHLPF